MKKDKIIKPKQIVKPVSVGMTDEEKQLVKAAAKQSDVSFSEFVRQSAVYMANA